MGHDFIHSEIWLHHRDRLIHTSVSMDKVSLRGAVTLGNENLKSQQVAVGRAFIRAQDIFTELHVHTVYGNLFAFQFSCQFLTAFILPMAPSFSQDVLEISEAVPAKASNMKQVSSGIFMKAVANQVKQRKVNLFSIAESSSLQ